MAEQRRQKIRDIVAQRRAQATRRALIESLKARVDLTNATFLHLEETERAGSLFWTLAGQQNEQVTDRFESIERLLQPECWPTGQVVYFHRLTRDAGALLLDVQSLLRHAADLRADLGPDFLFMSRSGAFGFAFEQTETGAVYRTWGCLCT